MDFGVGGVAELKRCRGGLSFRVSLLPLLQPLLGTLSVCLLAVAALLAVDDSVALEAESDEVPAVEGYLPALGIRSSCLHFDDVVDAAGCPDLPLLLAHTAERLLTKHLEAQLLPLPRVHNMLV